MGENVRRKRMKTPVIVACAIYTQLAKLAVVEAPDLHADLSTGRVHKAHAPRQAALRVGYTELQ